jgi:carboxypeptidase Q
MPKRLLAAALFTLPAPLAAQQAAPIDPTVAKLRDAALKDEVALSLLRDLTTEIGPRPPGSEAEARARDWAVRRLRAMGFANVRVDQVPMPVVWTRGRESVEVVGPFNQRLALTALAGSVATPAGGITAPVAMFETLEALQAAPETAVRGRIVFMTHRMSRTQDGASYVALRDIRRGPGPTAAAQKGAVAYLIRSLGTDSSRTPHTGATGFRAPPVPAAALSTADADQLERLLAKQADLQLRLDLQPSRASGFTGNVIAEVPGSDPDADIIAIGGHLDSWDLGTGAIDDGAGVAITVAAAKRLLDMPGRPRRTIRVILFGAEEPGIIGGVAYREKYAPDRHALVSESDFGADRVYGFKLDLPPAAAAVKTRVAVALAPLGIVPTGGPAGGGPDFGPMVATGVRAFDLQQDGTRYFDIHHTAEDTFDKVDPAQLRQNVAAWTAMLAVVANAPEEIGPVPVRK